MAGRQASTESPSGTEAAAGGGPARVRCRPIAPGDDAALAALLARGFPTLCVSAWAQALARLRAFHEGQRTPAIGYVLDDGGSLVGALLTLYAPDGRRCNLSSWYVDAGYRRFGQMLVSAATRDKGVTYLNVSSERHTRPIIRAQGFRPYCEGIVLALPLLAGGPRAAVTVAEGAPPAGAACDPAERALMERHAAMGCLALWCVAGGRAHPFVLSRRRVHGVPMAQVVYCPQETDWRLFARAVGRALARRGLFLMLVDAPGPLPGLPGRFLPGRMPKFARGPMTPWCGDLAYTEAALLGT